MSNKEKASKRANRVRKKIRGVANGLPRLSVFRSNKQIYAQIIDDVSSITSISASSIEQDYRKKCVENTKTEVARLVGKLIAERAVEAGIKKVKFDRGAYLYHGRVKALAEAAREGGLVF